MSAKNKHEELKTYKNLPKVYKDEMKQTVSV